jgi:hypothetical protein
VPVNFQQIQQKVKLIGLQAPAEQKKMSERRQLALNLLYDPANTPEKLEKVYLRALALNSGLRCAIPTQEVLTHRGAPPALDTPVVLLAADGSQINPDHHDPIEFGVINTGAIRIVPGSSEPPQEIIRSEMLYGDELQTDAGPVTEDVVAMRRDRNERTMLADLAVHETLPVVTLTDGQLELFHEPQQAGEFSELFTQYQEALHELARIGAVTAGFVDKPRADLVIRLLELLQLPDGEFHQAGHLHPFNGLNDAMLFLDLLQPGERSAVFGIQSRSADRFDKALSLHFFYINVGRPGRPWLARVELPRWVAISELLLNRLQAVLIQQCHQLGSKPYPYALHRAHEVAIVRFEEKDQLENMLILELRRQGVEVGEKSNKQFAKDNSGSRTRYS